MDFSLSEEHELFRKSVKEFMDKNLRPIARQIDDKEHIPEDFVKKMAQQQLLGITIPEEYGGPGGDVTMATLAVIEVGRADISMGTAVFTLLINGWSHIFEKWGTAKAKEEVLPKVAKGEAFMGIATTEACGGSDILGTKLEAKKVGNEYHLNGEKSFISGIKESLQMGGGHITVFWTNKPAGHKGMTFAYVPIHAKGIQTTTYKDMGRMGLSTGGLTYDNTPIPDYYVMGEPNKGFYVLMDGFNAARVLVSAACIGAAERTLELGIEYIKTRQLFGKPIATFQGIQFELAELYAQIEMAKMMVMKSAWYADNFKKLDKSQVSDYTKTVAIAKLYAPQVAFDVSRKVMNWFGAAGYTKDLEIEMGFRGITSYVVGAEGALNIMRVILGRELLGKDFKTY
jgi:acyl-CoA dehydrogenase